MKHIRIFLWGCLTVVTIILLWLKFVPTGEITYTHNFQNKNGFLSDLTPLERTEKEDGRVKILGDPAYFTLRTPRAFEEAEITFVYETGENEHPLIEAGILMSENDWRYKMKPVQNRVIDQLSSVWNVLREDNLILLQKEKEFDSIEDFRQNLPLSREFALYNYSLKQDYSLVDYQPAVEGQKLDIPLRGGYEFITYVKDEKMEFEFELFDINRNKEKDDVYLDLYYNGELLRSKHIKGDGISSDTKEINKLEKADIALQDMPEGVYKIEIRATDDIITKSIETKQKKLSFINRLQLAKPSVLGENKEDSYPLSMYFSGSGINAKTIYPDNLGAIKLENGKIDDLVLEDTYKKFSRNIPVENLRETTSTEILLEKGGMILSGDGNFSFSADSLLDPGYNRLRSSADVTDDFKFILADYTPPEEEGGRKKKTVKFDLDSAYSKKGEFPRFFQKYRFMISIPGLKQEDDINDHIIINEIRVKLKGKSLWEKY
ncbi:MAG: hypothetical protein ACOCVY_02395 [Patescibacteria group bacterium]